MMRVIVESPYGGEHRERNERYLNDCLADCFLRGEAPFASHAIGPRCLDDDNDEERRRGIEAGFAWRGSADLTAIYTDLGITAGMKLGIVDAANLGCDIEFRELGGEWATYVDTSSARIPGELAVEIDNLRRLIGTSGSESAITVTQRALEICKGVPQLHERINELEIKLRSKASPEQHWVSAENVYAGWYALRIKSGAAKRYVRGVVVRVEHHPSADGLVVCENGMGSIPVGSISKGARWLRLWDIEP